MASTRTSRTRTPARKRNDPKAAVTRPPRPAQPAAITDGKPSELEKIASTIELAADRVLGLVNRTRDHADNVFGAEPLPPAPTTGVATAGGANNHAPAPSPRLTRINDAGAWLHQFIDSLEHHLGRTYEL